jgi:LytS/YehU family sensor histidine kinase
VLEKLTFPNSSNNLTFHFSNINLLNPEKDRFTVQLEGFDKEFKDIGIQQIVEYTNLPAGNYKFVVRVVNTNTLVRQEKILLEFTIKPPYWQTWWFLTVVAILLIVLVTGLFKLRTTQIRKDVQTKLDMAELEMQALQSQMNPHFFFNVMNSLQRYILERDTDKGLGLLGNINSMVRQTFTLASKKVISIQEEVTYLDSYLKLEQVRSGNKFQYEISVDPSLNQNEPIIPPMLIQPMVENAVKHGLMPLDGNDGLLQISFTHHEKHSLCCTITDNGIGIQNSLNSKRDTSTRLSKALNITQRRIELLRRSTKSSLYSMTILDLRDTSKSESGTVVEILLPLYQEQ